MSTSSEAERLKVVDSDFSAASAAHNLVQAYSGVLDMDARLHRNGLFPITESTAIAVQVRRESEKGVMTWMPMYADVAASADLGYSYGNYTIVKSGTPEPVEKGSYAHIWRRNAKGEWKLAVDIVTSWPPSKN